MVCCGGSLVADPPCAPPHGRPPGDAPPDPSPNLPPPPPLTAPQEDSAKQPPRDWRSVIDGAGLVPGVTGKTVAGVYSGKRPEAEVAAEAAGKQPAAAQA